MITVRCDPASLLRYVNSSYDDAESNPTAVTHYIISLILLNTNVCILQLGDSVTMHQSEEMTEFLQLNYKVTHVH